MNNKFYISIQKNCARFFILIILISSIPLGKLSGADISKESCYLSNTFSNDNCQIDDTKNNQNISSTSINRSLNLAYLPAFMPVDEVIAEWNFEDVAKRATNLPYTADDGIASNTNIAPLSLNGGPAFTAFVAGSGGGGTSAPNSNTWTAAGDKYWQVIINTIGYEDLTVSSKQRGSNTGPRDFKVQYSLNGTTWTDVPSTTIVVANNFTSGVLTDIALPAACENQATVYLRWLQVGTTAVNGNPVASTGTNRIDDVVIKGTEFDVCANITIDGNITDFGDPIGSGDAGVNYYFSSDDLYFYVGVTNINLGNDNIHIAFRNADGSTNSSTWGVDFSDQAWTYLITFFGADNICYYAFSDPFGCQQVGNNWSHFAGWTDNTTSEIRIPRSFLGTAATGNGTIEMTIWGNNNAGNFVFTTFPENPTGQANITWEAFETVSYPCDYEPPTCDIMFTTQSSTASACDEDSGVITLEANSSAEESILYEISGPVSANNMTGIFENLPSGVYTVTASFGEECNTESEVTVLLEEDEINPTASNPEPSSYGCLQDVPAPNPDVVTDAADNCPTCVEMVWINEFHYDNVGTDVGEFIEVAGVAGTDLSGYTLELFNGQNPSNVLRYNVRNLSGIIPDLSNGLGTLSFAYPVNGIQNGPRDGIALIKGSTVVQLISYEGPMTVAAGQGAASGMVATPINVFEASNTPIGFSLQLKGSGNKYEDFTWAVPGLESPGSINAGQTFTQCDNTMVTFLSQTVDASSGEFGDPTVITRTYEVKDASGNSINVTHTITVTDVICGWSAQANGVNCNEGNSASYNSTTQVFTVTSTNCYYANPFNSDSHAFAQYELCGNGSITAQVTSISGALAWAGVTMRESNLPSRVTNDNYNNNNNNNNNAAGAKKAQLMTNLSNFSRREFRTTTNGSAYPQQFPSQNRYWLRIVRTGNQFVMYISPNNLSWFFAGAQNISMQSCIQIGLVVTNYNANSTATATFANVSVTGGMMRPVATEGVDPVEAVLDWADFNISPNPTTGAIRLDLSAYGNRNVQMEVINLQGQVMQSNRLSSNGYEDIDLSAYSNGMYLIRVRSEGLPDVTKRVVLSNR